jgi:CHAD domain-containing protein
MSPTGRSVEREVKLAVDVGFSFPDLGAVTGTVVTEPGQRTRTLYFDTADHRLLTRAVTLRHRSGETPGAGTWTLKLPEAAAGDTDGPATLDRAELTWSGPSDVVPPEATRIVRGLVRSAPLSSIAELRSTRQRLVLRDATGADWGELDDDTVTVTSSDAVHRFRQIEVELTGSGAASLADVVDALRAAGARPDPEAKLTKALRLSGQGTDPGTTVAVGRTSTMRDVVVASIRRGVDQLLGHDVRLRADGGEPAAHDVHQARVATRRLRSDLKLVGGGLDPVWLVHTRDELRWLGGVLGAVRDADVLSGSLRTADSVTEAGGTLELRVSLDDERRAAARELASALEAPRYLALVDRLAAASISPPFADSGRRRKKHRHRRGARAAARRVLPRLVGRRLRSLRRAVRSAGRHPSDGELHRIRIKAKQLRYAAETATPVLGGPARRMASAAEDLQTVLGEHHDSVAAESWLRRQATAGTRSAAFSAGILVAGQRRLQRRLRHRWRPVWDRLNRPKLRRFLD